MKTTPWTPSTTAADATWAVDDAAIFTSDATKVDVSTQVLPALLAGSAYAGRGLPFQIFSRTREELVRFTPGSAVEGVSELVWALNQIAAHMDRQVRDAVFLGLATTRDKLAVEVDKFVNETLEVERAKLEQEFAARAAEAGLAPTQPDEVPEAADVAPEAPEAPQG